MRVRFKGIIFNNGSKHIIDECMKEIVKYLDEHLVYLKHEVYPDYLEIFVFSSRESALCPYCGHSSSRIHSTYPRHFQDLPIQGKKVNITLRSRKYFCSNPECTRNTFAEPFDFIEPKARKTNRVLAVIMNISTEVSSVTASEILSDGIVDIGKSAICKLLQEKLANEMNKASVERICMDDFAFKKGHYYGTVMVDIDSRCIIDILPSRETADVAKWLLEYPNIKLVVRDGSVQYAAAIKQAHPNAIQVSDRFHILKNLMDYAKEHIKKHISSTFQIEAVEGEQGMGSDFGEDEENHRANLPEMNHLIPTKEEQARVEQVCSLAEEGFFLSDIEKEVDLSHVTVKEDLNSEVVPENKLEPYTEKIDAMLQARCKFKEIEAAIREDGYKGTRSALQVYTTQRRRILKEVNAEATKNTETVKRKELIKLLYLPIEKMKDVTSEQLERVVHEYPVIGTIYELVCSFKEMMFTKQVQNLESWIERALQLQIEEMNSFVRGISRDLEAVKNAIALEYNNGLAEGSVNKLKVAKRIMYGRNSFILLRNKILLKEFGWSFN